MAPILPVDTLGRQSLPFSGGPWSKMLAKTFLSPPLSLSTTSFWTPRIYPPHKLPLPRGLYQVLLTRESKQRHNLITTSPWQLGKLRINKPSPMSQSWEGRQPGFKPRSGKKGNLCAHPGPMLPPFSNAVIFSQGSAAHRCAARVCITCDTWRFRQGHWPLSP